MERAGSERLVVRTLIGLALFGLLILTALSLLGRWQPRVSPLAFLALLTVESLLLAVAISTHRLSSIARVAIFVVPLALTLGLRLYQAIATEALLDWDETYYLSMAVTAADGRGVYPYIYGYGPMAIMGGAGYAAYVNALAVEIAGPSLIGLRIVSWLASVAGVFGMWVLVRMWYGTGAAWMAAALMSALRLFVMSNSARPDSMTFAYVIGAMAVSAAAFKHWPSRKWHLVSGLIFGLGLQVHIDTAVTALAIGVTYIVMWLKEMIARRGFVAPSQFLSYAVGGCIGLALFVVFNILPDPEAFYTTTVRIRVDATSWYSGGSSTLLGSFLNPAVLLAKEWERYGVVFRALPRLEVILFGMSLIALVVRGSVLDRRLLTIIAMVMIVASIVLNNASVLYFIHVVPALMIPIAPLFTHGFSRQSPIPTREIGFVSLLAFVVVVSALVAVNSAKAIPRSQPPSATHAAGAELASRVRTVAGGECIIAGDGNYYVHHFADYPFFISTRPTEVTYAMLFYRLKDEAEYWRIKAPEVVVTDGPLSPGLSAYVQHSGLQQVQPGVWMVPDGCKAAGRQSR